MIRFFMILMAFVISACSSMSQKYVTPRALLDSSVENVSFTLHDNSSTGDVVEWMQGDVPTAAILSCDTESNVCNKVRDILSLNSVPFSYVEPPIGGPESVKLTYQRVVAKDCKVEILGCSVSANSVQMVPDQRQFIRPALSDPQDAARAVSAYNSYMK